MAVNSYDPTTGRPIFVDTDAPDIKVDPTQAAVYAADVGNRVVRANLSALDAYPYKRKGLVGFALDTGYEYVHDGAAWTTASAFVLLGSQSVIGSGIITFDNVFNARFQNYMIRVNARSMTTGGVIAFRLRAGGVDASGGSDYRTVSRTSSTTTVTAAATAEDRAPLTRSVFGATYSEIRLFDPAIAARTVALINSHGVTSKTTAENTDITMHHNPTVAYDGFRIITSGPGITGSVSIFGIG